MKCLLLKSFSSESRKYAGWHCDLENSEKSLSSIHPLSVAVNEIMDEMQKKLVLQGASAEHAWDCQGLLSGLLILSLNVLLIVSPY